MWDSVHASSCGSSQVLWVQSSAVGSSQVLWVQSSAVGPVKCCGSSQVLLLLIHTFCLCL